jgi:hypothetical protein
MKFNQWTLALAAVGVVSLASAAKAEEKPSAVSTALASTTIGGYVDTSAQWNFGTGDRNPAPYKFNTPNKADGFNLDVVQLTLDKALEPETAWSAGYHVDLWFGPDANVLGTQSIYGHTGDFAIRQAYVALNTPVGNGLNWKVGVFDTVIGYESVDAAYPHPNANYTRSYGHSMEPQTHTGVMANYAFCKDASGNAIFSASGGVADTIGPTINERAFEGLNASGLGFKAESYKTYFGAVQLAAPDSMGFLAGSTLDAGIVNGWGDKAAVLGKGDQTSYYIGALVHTPLKELNLGAAFDYLDIYGVHGETWALSGYASVQATEKLSFNARAEYMKDDAGLFNLLSQDGGFPVDAKVLALTGTVQYDLWKNVISRVEFRWDHSLNDTPDFGGTVAGAPSLKNAFMLAANVIYKF